MAEPKAFKAFTVTLPPHKHDYVTVDIPYEQEKKLEKYQPGSVWVVRAIDKDIANRTHVVVLERVDGA